MNIIAFLGWTKVYSLPAKDRFDGLDPCGSHVQETTIDAGKPKLSLRYSPNHSKGTISIGYTLDKTAEVRLALYNLSGKLVQNLTSGIQTAGTHSLSVSPVNMPKGLYLLQLRTGDHTLTCRTIVP